VLQDADVELTLIQAIAKGLGVALLPVQAKRIPHDNVVFRELRPRILTESCIAWKGDNPSTALKAYIKIVSDRGTRMR
jgi:DNA-binding transcriptional LysR family regulator